MNTVASQLLNSLAFKEYSIAFVNQQNQIWESKHMVMFSATLKEPNEHFTQSGACCTAASPVLQTVEVIWHFVSERLMNFAGFFF